MTQARFRDTGEVLWSFATEVFVECPGCGKCARVLPKDREAGGPFSARRLVCRHCGCIREPEGEMSHWGGSEGLDPYFEIPLWLRTRSCGETLWAFNAEHLAFLEELVAATLREKRPNPKTGWSNQSLANRLPRWIKAGKNREEVLRAIRSLKERCPDA